MAESVVSFAVERLGDLLIQEGKFLSGVSDQVEGIKDELKRMKCFLKDADEKQDINESVRNWVGEIRDLAYETENVLETFAIKVASRREGRGIKNIMRRFACIFGEGVALHKVGSEIGTIRTKIISLTASLQTYGVRGFTEGESSHSAYDKQQLLRTSYAHLIEEDFVGMEKDEEQLVSHLVSSDKLYVVISIKGMGGQGKTTIATRIYNCIDVRRNFEGFAWVCITQKCQTKSIWQDILRQLLPDKKEEVEQMGDTELVQQLYKVQQEKKCLIVLDDLWSTNDWESLKPAFPIKGIAGTKILLTTRKLDVAKVGVVHELGYLNEDEGWELLQKKAFPRKDLDPDFKADRKMEKLGRDMVKKCKGLPLAISVLGGFLKDKNTSREWEMVSENISRYLRAGEGIEEDYRAVTQVLALSFNDLPYCLKPCFLYLGCFLEDAIIDVEKLCLLWMAEGLVSSNHRGKGETIMDVTERYLDEFARRSMVQMKKQSYEPFSSIPRRFSTCRLHDLMREMCMSKGEKEDFHKLMDYRSQPDKELTLLMTSSSTKTRRLANYFGEDIRVNIPSKQHEKVRHIRSLLLIGSYPTGRSLPSEIPGIKEFKFLRVLDVNGIRFVDKNLKGISELILLRHLSFADCVIEKFPSSIGNLRYLQTLDLRVTEFVVQRPVILPNVLWKMKQLRHLFLPVNYCSEGDQKLRLNGLLQLEVLVNFYPTVCDVEDVVKLNKLWFFGVLVDRRGHLEDLASVIKYLNSAASCHLRNTTVQIMFCSFRSEDELSLLRDLFGCHTLHKLVIDGYIDKLPKYDHRHQFSSSLTCVLLHSSALEEDPMVTLEKLPSLRFLCLGRNAFVGKEMICSSVGFPQLTTLQLGFLSNLEKWHVEKGAMPNLYHLTIRGCQKLEMLPEGLKFLHALKKLEISFMPEAFKNRVRVVDGEEGEDFDKVRHVSSVKISPR